MKHSNLIVIYGSYGYTGKLIVAECLKRNLNVLLAGRNNEALESQSVETGFSYQTVNIKDAECLAKLLTPAQVVIHCGGPFLFTAKHMVNACLESKTHYTDITGEIGVFELLSEYDDKAKNAGIMVLPGVGFDVVPSDCLAAHLKSRLPEATHLELAFATSGGGSSRGTSKTAVLGLGEGSRIRKDGVITKVPLHSQMKEIDFGKFKTISARIPWGDVSTAYHSTGIPNIAVYMGINDKIARLLKATRFFNWLLKKRWLKGLLLNRLDRIQGPNETVRGESKSYLIGKAWNNSKSVETRLETPNGYTLTAVASTTIAERILNGDFKVGFQTPSSAYGADFILSFDGVKRSDL